MDFEHLFVIGIDQRTPLELREKVMTGQSVPVVLRKIGTLMKIHEPVLLMTCQRFELYGLWSGSLDAVLDAIKTELFAKDLPERYFVMYKGLDAVRHLFRVACGLESMALGEDHVLGQVKKAWLESHENGYCGKFMHMLFRQAVTLGKKCRTQLGREVFIESISSLAVRVIEQELGSVKGKRALVIGRGEMGWSAIHHLAEKGVKDITLVCRHPEKANVDLLGPSVSAVIGPAEKYEALSRCDIAVSVTDAPHYTIEYEPFRDRHCRRALCLVDLAIPRDIDPRIGTLTGITLLTLQTLKNRGFSPQERDMDIVKHLESAIEVETRKFQRRSTIISCDPLIQDWHVYAKTVCRDEFKRIETLLEELPEAKRLEYCACLERVGRKVVNHGANTLKQFITKGEIISEKDAKDG